MQSDLNLAKLHFELSLEAINQGNYAQAEKELILANSLSPHRPSILTNLSAVFIRQKKWQEAEDVCRVSLEIEPKNIEALINLGMCALHRTKNVEALNYFNLATEIDPQAQSAWVNKGNILQELEKFEEAELCLKKALKLNPHSEEALIGMGNLSNELKRYADGLNYFSMALTINPANAQAKWNKALSLLRLGDFNEGWKLYESRWQIDGMREYSKYQAVPLWLGNDLIAKKNILIYAEQGFGDAIQMARYLPILEHNLGAKVCVEVPEPLFELMQSVSPSIKVISSTKAIDQQAVDQLDYQCPIMSLPLALKTTLHSIPQNVPYLFAKEDKRLFWKQRLNDVSQRILSNNKKLRIGLTWSGSGHYAGKNSLKRDLPFGQVISLVNSLPSELIEFHAIQKDIHDSWIKSAPNNLFFHVDYLNNFADSAALIAELDVVISIDTAVGHLAGALGKDTFLLIPDPPDFMAMVGTNKSVWYPKTELIRQYTRGAWSIKFIKESILGFKPSQS